jgi:hypothetical protein
MAQAPETTDQIKVSPRYRKAQAASKNSIAQKTEKELFLLEYAVEAALLHRTTSLVK